MRSRTSGWVSILWYCWACYNVYTHDGPMGHSDWLPTTVQSARSLANRPASFGGKISESIWSRAIITISVQLYCNRCTDEWSEIDARACEEQHAATSSVIYLRNRKHFPCFQFPYSYRNTSGSLGKREIEVGTRVRRANVSTLFRVLPNFHECFYNVWEHRKKCFRFLL